MPKGYIVFISSVHPFICPSFCLCIRLSILPSVHLSVIPCVNTCNNQVLLRSFLIMYISTATYQKLFTFGMGVPWRVLFHSTSMDPRVMPRGGARGQNLGYLNKVVYCYNQVILLNFLIMYISAVIYQNFFIFAMGVPGKVVLHSTSKDPWVMPRGGARGQNLGCLNKVVYCYNQVYF